MTTDHSQASASIAAAPEVTGTASVDFDPHTLAPTVDLDTKLSANTASGVDTSGLRSHMAETIANLKSDAGTRAHETVDAAIKSTPGPAPASAGPQTKGEVDDFFGRAIPIGKNFLITKAFTNASAYIPSADTCHSVFNSGLESGKSLVDRGAYFAALGAGFATEKTGELYSLASEKTGGLYGLATEKTAELSQAASEFTQSEGFQQGTEAAKEYRSGMWSYLSENPGTAAMVLGATGVVGYGAYKLFGGGRGKSTRGSASRSSQKSKK